VGKAWSKEVSGYKIGNAVPPRMACAIAKAVLDKEGENDL